MPVRGGTGTVRRARGWLAAGVAVVTCATGALLAVRVMLGWGSDGTVGAVDIDGYPSGPR